MSMWLKFFQILSTPLSIIYNLITSIRNYLYDRGFISSFIPEIKTIGVGNLSMGGTGKTPMIEYLIRTLLPTHKIAVLSRGYKRKTKGFILANEQSNSDEIGDELYQIHRKFGKSVYIVADANRQRAIQMLAELPNPPEIILLDDSFQHRKVKPGLNILLTSYSNPYFSDRVFPSGFLRENKSGSQRADSIVVSKCDPNLNVDKIEEFKLKLNALPTQSIGFTTIEYGNCYFLKDGSEIQLNHKNSIIVVTGFVQTNTMIDYLVRFTKKMIHLSFKDHHSFTQKDIQLIENKLNDSKSDFILVSEKDAARLYNNQFMKEDIASKILVLPIETNFVNTVDKDKFNLKIKNYVD